jgi:ABC-type Fe3+-siderophore transport system permease subunit
MMRMVAGLTLAAYAILVLRAVLRDPAASEELLGGADIQSLADLGNCYALVREMRSVPFGLEDITRLAAATAAPLLPSSR